MPRSTCAVRMESEPSPVAAASPAEPRVAPVRPVRNKPVFRAVPRRRREPDRRFEGWLLTAVVLLACALAAILVHASRHVEATF